MEDNAKLTQTELTEAHFMLRGAPSSHHPSSGGTPGCVGITAGKLEDGGMFGVGLRDFIHERQTPYPQLSVCLLDRLAPR